MLMPYDWTNLPAKLPITFMAYSQMIGEHSMELANSINELRRLTSSLEAWKSLIEGKSDEGKDELVIEFIDSPTTVALNLPYVIRSRFIYSIAHLCHQANQTQEGKWKDDLPIDTEIYFKESDHYGSGWHSYKKLKLALERIADKKYQKDSYDFRNKYNHRYSPRIELGLTGLVTRNVGPSGQVSYGFGYTQPLKLDKIVKLLKNQHALCSKAFFSYQKLVTEHAEAIKCA